MIARRSFIRGIGALLAAPAIVRAASLMPVRALTDAQIELMLRPPGLAEGVEWTIFYGNSALMPMLYSGFTPLASTH